MIPQRLIASKRAGEEIDPAEFRSFLAGYLDGRVEDSQMAAFLMAVCFNGLGDKELAVLVDAMIRSGESLDRDAGPPGPRVDKHSTGGVGDKVSLPLAPLAAEMGMVVPMISGRGLGHTGGTLDKLESIPGFETRISLERFHAVLRDTGCAMIGQTREIAPLDRRLYALRDVTATVASLPLITASIMSKKLAETLDGLVLDVKVGSGAFLSSAEEARALAEAMVRVGASRGLEVTAVLSAMDRPLGRAVGHGLEVEEAVECLSGGGPEDLRELTVELAAEMALAGGLAASLDEGRGAAEALLASGAALERFCRMVSAQGGDPGFVASGRGLPAAPLQRPVLAARAGVVAAVEPRELGYALVALGGGRTRQDQEIDPRAGFRLEVQVGQEVEEGRPLAVVHGAGEDRIAAAERAVAGAFRIAESADTDGLPLILERLSASENSRLG